MCISYTYDGLIGFWDLENKLPVPLSSFFEYWQVTLYVLAGKWFGHPLLVYLSWPYEHHAMFSSFYLEGLRWFNYGFLISDPKSCHKIFSPAVLWRSMICFPFMRHMIHVCKLYVYLHQELWRNLFPYLLSSPLLLENGQTRYLWFCITIHFLEKYPGLLLHVAKKLDAKLFLWIMNLQCFTFYIVIGDVPRVNGQLAVSRAFGDKSLKSHLRSDPDILDITIDVNCDILILASDGLWKVIYLFHKEKFKVLLSTVSHICVYIYLSLALSLFFFFYCLLSGNE